MGSSGSSSLARGGRKCASLEKGPGQAACHAGRGSATGFVAGWGALGLWWEGRGRATRAPGEGAGSGVSSGRGEAGPSTSGGAVLTWCLLSGPSPCSAPHFLAQSLPDTPPPSLGVLGVFPPSEVGWLSAQLFCKYHLLGSLSCLVNAGLLRPLGATTTPLPSFSLCQSWPQLKVLPRGLALPWSPEPARTSVPREPGSCPVDAGPAPLGL